MITSFILSTALALCCAGANPTPDGDIKEGILNYTPSPEVLASRERFSDDKFGIFIHWGVYSMMGLGEWAMNEFGIRYDEYSTLPKGFYPANFNAAEWVKAFKAAGAKYITITSRHHDGFSMFKSEASDYNIVDATPFGRDVLKELADECHKQGLTINFYYSLLDWGRGDYPQGTSGKNCGKNPDEADINHYVDFMCKQITELLTNYGPVGAIWFDGDWDQTKAPEDGEECKATFDWQYGRIYSLIHSLQPACLVGNNHHRMNIPGEDIQLFEKDVPGGNTTGFSRTNHISQSLPLETCQTMNHSWGVNMRDREWKSSNEIIRYIISTAGRNANLLLNIGPRSDGSIPQPSLERFEEIGRWMSANGDAIYGTRATLLPPQDWGVVTHKDKRIFLHVTSMPEGGVITLPFSFKAKSVTAFGTGEKISFKKGKKDFKVTVPQTADCTTDFIIEIIKN